MPISKYYFPLVEHTTNLLPILIGLCTDSERLKWCQLKLDWFRMVLTQPKRSTSRWCHSVHLYSSNISKSCITVDDWHYTQIQDLAIFSRQDREGTTIDNRVGITVPDKLNGHADLEGDDPCQRSESSSREAKVDTSMHDSRQSCPQTPPWRTRLY